MRLRASRVRIFSSGATMLLIDIDGALNPWENEECPAGFCEYRLFPESEEPVRRAAVHGKWLMELGEQFNLVWASAWGFQAHRLLAWQHNLSLGRPYGIVGQRLPSQRS